MQMTVEEEDTNGLSAMNVCMILLTPMLHPVLSAAVRSTIVLRKTDETYNRRVLFMKNKFFELDEENLESVSGGCAVGVCDDCISADIHDTYTGPKCCPNCGKTDFQYSWYNGQYSYYCSRCDIKF